MIRWPWRSNRQYPRVLREFDVEETFYIIPYIFKESRVRLTVHLPSMRVSERHYDEFDNIIKYYHNSAMSTEHISNICKQDPSLQEYIATAKARVGARAKPKSRRIRYLMIALVVWWIVWIVIIIVSQCNGGVG